ncbi:Neuropeptide-Like Protein [Caenorhabditis elegans]|uniref:Neuropeptide-Like Protein n=1 Tax=Caenorhabditis elegans TaxID=6239 RepID=C1P630_CAEEL|nr:Neuropeptide-Like Protein [Caenorhabditis elegans]CAX65077.1 Neuropeptide-Like Protein [Caenorhabditis elegans]|eukprot:NP_001255405.1 Uncharacterized protein CELE_W09C2.7 [Caenorhabditis elegans]
MKLIIILCIIFLFANVFAVRVGGRRPAGRGSLLDEALRQRNSGGFRNPRSINRRNNLPIIRGVTSSFSKRNQTPMVRGKRSLLPINRRPAH